MKIILFTFVLYASFLQAQSKIIVSQSIHDIDKNTLIFSIDTSFYDVEIVKTTDKHVTVETTVTSNTGSKSVLSYLRNQGRYNINVYQHAKFHATIFYLNHDKKDIYINGSTIHEDYHFIIRVPSDMKIKVKKPQDQSIASS